MASWYGRKRGYSSGYSRRKGGRRGYSRYGSRRFAGKKRTSTTSSRMSMRKLREQVQSLALVQQHGQARKVTFNASLAEVKVPAFGQSAQSYYFGAPVSEILLHGICARVGKQSVFVTGVVLELDIYHAARMDFFAVCVPVCGSVGLPTIALDTEIGQFSLLDGPLDAKKGVNCEPPLWNRTHPFINGMAAGVFSENARDGTLFNAPMRPTSTGKGEVMVNGKAKSRHTGRASLSFGAKGDANGLVSDNFVRESVRVWWSINKSLPVCNAAGGYLGDRYSILCGLRPQVDPDLSLSEKPTVKKVAYFQGLRVMVHVRV
ncbi:hypothetical protein HIM_12209 [Hirsutella minnesotensis 3608]|uniref:Uncharacterized protein n=1 Tax=Hirsutella minnesotensis 3608 TaxID=1043627 RepID=A0A0F7ZQT0_9HYPO|nr:hypothetical protein HIM_12209 [Hirsutella minnesotensis 3608]